MTDDHPTLLAKLAPKFRESTENIAVEALGHILSESKDARREMTKLVRVCGSQIGQIVDARTQSTGEDGARPDLACRDDRGNECVLIEAKFWAALTENQPVEYLRRLSDQEPSALLFVAPVERIDSLWGVLRRRVDESDIALEWHENEGWYRSATAGDTRRLILIHWASLRDPMAAAASAASDRHTENDIRQLRGLAIQSDEDAFLPLRQEELGPDVPRRLRNLARLVDRVTDRLVASGLADTTGLKVTPLRTGYGRYLMLAGAGARWGLDHEKWATLRETPLWLILHGNQPGWDRAKPFGEICHNLESLRLNDPSAMIEGPDHLLLPIYVPAGVEEDLVLDEVVRHLERIARLIGPA